MNITKNIEKIIGYMLKEQGFVLKKDIRVWQYTRKKGEINQNIIFLGHRYFKGHIKAIFYADAYGQGMYEFRNFVPDSNPSEEFWEYKNEAELRLILEQFKEWIIKYGFSFLEEISKPATEVRPKPETNLYLYQNHKEIYERYQKEWDLSDGEKTVQLIQTKIEELYDEDFKKVEKTLIEYAAVYGYAMCIDGIGTWMWDEEKKTCIVSNVGGMKTKIEPLEDIILSYANQSEIVISRYRSISLYKKHLLELKAKKVK